MVFRIIVEQHIIYGAALTGCLCFFLSQTDPAEVLPDVTSRVWGSLMTCYMTL